MNKQVTRQLLNLKERDQLV